VVEEIGVVDLHPPYRTHTPFLSSTLPSRLYSKRMPHFRSGLDSLLDRHCDWLRGRRVALLSHSASVDRLGCTAAQRLWDERGVGLVALMGPEHGFAGSAGAGVACRSRRHPDWDIPIHSLYGKTRKPTPRMLEGADVLVIAMQDIATRCYTYVSTLQLALEAAAEQEMPVIVADHPIPLPNTVDGPILDPAFSSFVGLVGTPLSYGMTPGETSAWIAHELRLSLDLRVAKLDSYRRQSGRDADWPPWIPPSPAMLSWESARCFPTTVVFEALPAVDCGRSTTLPFQLVGAEWTKGEALAETLNNIHLPGVCFFPHRYDAQPRQTTPLFLDGVRMVVTVPDTFRPALTSVHLVHTLQTMYGKPRVWKNARNDWFDKLFATDTVRRAILDNERPGRIAAAWTHGLKAFLSSRSRALLYQL
jgi:uncharacterized protein YbbC (DUF1343 family)